MLYEVITYGHIIAIGKTAGTTGLALEQHAMASCSQFAYTGRRHTYAKFLRFYLFWHTDNHAVLPVITSYSIHYTKLYEAASGGQLDAANLIKPILSAGLLRCIGSTTYQEYAQIFEKDHALARRFQKVDIVEPSVDDTTRILMGLKSRYEEHHNVRYTAKARNNFV